MVEGMNSFREKFREFSDCYTVIGGAAGDILMSEAALEFRATKDIDIILILEARGGAFGKAFWEYVREGGYRCGWKQSPEMHFYRFTEPKPGYPTMLELFSRDPGYHLEFPGDVVPIHLDEDVSSLSAILLDDGYYRFMKEGRQVVDGVAVLAPEYLIPFKMYAWINLTQRKAEGGHVNERDLKKHKNDVFRLLQIVETGKRMEPEEPIQANIRAFLDAMEQQELRLNQIGLPWDKSHALMLLKRLYGVEG